MESSVKTMEKISHVWVVKKYSATKNFRVGQWIRSGIIKAPGDGDYSFRIYLYPRGKTQSDSYSKSLCLRVQNESRNTVEFLYSLEVLPVPELAFLKFSHYLQYPQYYHQRSVYRAIVTAPPQSGDEIAHFQQRVLETSPTHCYLFLDCIKIRVTIGYFRDQPLSRVPQPFDPFVFIKAGEQRFYADESVLKARCPALLPPPPPDGSTTTQDIVLSDIDSDTFSAVLWYIYHKKLHRDDRYAISVASPRDPNSLGVKMYVAARRLNLQHLMRLLQVLAHLGSTPVTYGVWGDIYRALRNCGAKADKVKVKEKLIKTKSTTHANSDEN